MASVSVERVTLKYLCDECGATATQPLSDIVLVGTLMCPNCGDLDMELDADVIIAE